MLRRMERSTIHLLHKRGKSQREIARELGRSRATIARVLTEPVDCKDSFTDYAIETGFGSLQKCEQQQKGPQSVKSLEVQDVGGVSEVSAFVDGVPEGGPDDGALIEYNLVYQDGAFKLDTQTRFPDEYKPPTD